MSPSFSVGICGILEVGQTLQKFFGTGVSSNSIFMRGSYKGFGDVFALFALRNRTFMVLVEN